MKTGTERTYYQCTRNYVIDAAKLNSVTSAYQATKGIVTEQEKDIAAKAAGYEAEIEPLLRNKVLVANSLEDDAKQLIDIQERKEDL